MPDGVGASWSAQVVAIENEGAQRAFVSLDDLERIATKNPAILGTVLQKLRVVFESWRDRSGGVYVRKPG
jgi:hypothetical protein